MLDTILQVWDTISPVIVPVLVTVGGATGISIFTPNSSTIKILDILLTILNAISGNLHKNKNKDDK